mmetsp:Transcript_64162/g.191226  ORF Transcript_64162/g.191226 Transcript_64162/m.191226 type:complete len:264 (+) Transcript_64162:747-1538(+)
MQLVGVLLQEGLTLIDDFARVVRHCKVVGGKSAGLVDDARGFELAVDLAQEGVVCGAGHEALRVHEAEETQRPLAECVDNWLVVLELDVVPLDPLAVVHLLFQREHVVVEVLLELLVCEVDAQLLEGVPLEDLKAVDVQEPDAPQIRFAGALSRDALVDAPDQPVEEPREGDLRHGVARVGGGLQVVGPVDRLLRQRVLQSLVLQHAAELLRLYAKQVADQCCLGRLVDRHAVLRIALARGEGEVAKVQHGGDDAEHRVALLP